MQPPVPDASDTSKRTPSWYRHFWPWVVFGIPAATIVAGVVTLYLASKTQDSLVADDYYKQGLAINRVLDKVASANRQQIQARLNMSGNHFEITLSGKADPWPDSLSLYLLHPTLGARDHTFLLRRRGKDLVYDSDQELPSSGHWNIRLLPNGEDWQINDSIRLPLNGEARLQNRPTS